VNAKRALTPNCARALNPKGGDLRVVGRLRGRDGFVRGIALLLVILLCLLVAYALARADAVTMVAAFLRRVRSMGQP
jgi:hypothetical protein